VQADDIIPDVYNPQSLNRYSYVYNNPLKYTDPSGNILWVPFVIAVACGVGAEVEYGLTTPPEEQTMEGMVGHGVLGTASSVPAARAIKISSGTRWAERTALAQEVAIDATVEGGEEMGRNIITGDPLLDGVPEAMVAGGTSTIITRPFQPGGGQFAPGTFLGALTSETGQQYILSEVGKEYVFQPLIEQGTDSIEQTLSTESSSQSSQDDISYNTPIYQTYSGTEITTYDQDYIQVYDPNYDPHTYLSPPSS